MGRKGVWLLAFFDEILQIAAGQTSKGLEQLYDDFIVEATRLRDKYSGQIDILIGFESEWMGTPLHDTVKEAETSNIEYIQKIKEKHCNTLDFFIGSVHHVHRIPIDYSRELYLKARDVASSVDRRRTGDHGPDGSSDDVLFKEYFDSQYDMLRTLKPLVVGHFDLIRLYSDRPDEPLRTSAELWKHVMRNLEFIANYGGILEINSSSLRKGLTEPYPQLEICKVCCSP